ncbi:LPS export ABC transporter periplasmic protein LptC [Candidatus Cardinium hertigii]|uniref:LPS export ABC transporter periplasmic protein LptC n=1 Tax=Candidatus Cardinium hertigii TaxID=247481 RepID=UPI0013A56861|nr:LPS export ABC transporter periplasmic protein LptC [Candidatus Cardinium hertigii]
MYERGFFVPLYATAVMPERVPMVETMQCALLATDNGKSTFTIKANEMYCYENGDIVLVGKLEIVVWDTPAEVSAQEKGVAGAVTQGEDSTYIQANKLIYSKQEKLCTIEGKVCIQKPSEALELYTEQLCYNTEKENLFTEQPVAIVHKKNLFKGSGLWATKDLKQYILKRPCGSMELAESLETNQ